jgi:uncharacterized membrane protein YkvA (DUF1232 family)
MSEILAFVNRGAAKVTPATTEKVLRKLPLWKAEFTQLPTSAFPHLEGQLQFLAEAVEDVLGGAYAELPYCALAGAVFALTYTHNAMDLIPDHQGELGLADDSSVVRAVLLQHEKAFARYAQSRGISWDQITSEP